MKDFKKFDYNKIAILFTILSCGLITVLRIALTPGLYNQNIGKVENSNVLIAVSLISFVVIFILNLFGKKNVISLNQARRKQGLFVVITGMIFGAGLLASTVYDIFMWVVDGKIPPPTQIEVDKLNRINSFNKLLIYAVFLLGFLAALFMVWFSLSLLNRSITQDNLLAIGILLPVAWMWFRVIRYVVSYASAVRISESFYDFMMIIFSLLFLFFLARNISGIGKNRTAILMTCGMLTFSLTVSSSVSRFILFLKGDEQTALAGNLTGVPDFLLGLFALAVVSAFAYNHIMVRSEKRLNAESTEAPADSADFDTSANSADFDTPSDSM